MKINRYRVKRDNSNECKFFRVKVPEIKQWGFGFQFSINGIVYGCSITNN